MGERDKRVPTVLFVDDEPEICKSLARALREYGYETESTTDPHQAIEMVERSDYDLAVVDLVMPQMEGIDLVKRLLRVDPRIRCLILTAYGAVESCNRAYQAGIVRYLQKPVSVKVLNEIFIELLESSRTSLLPLPALVSLIGDSPKEEPKSLAEAAMPKVVIDEGEPEEPESEEEAVVPPDPNEVTLETFRRSAIKRYLTNASNLCNGSPKQIAIKAGISLPTVYRLLAEYDVAYDRKSKRKKKEDF